MGTKNGLIGDIILGIVGGFIFALIFDRLGISFAGYLGTILESLIGVCVLIFAFRLIFRK